MIRRRPHVPPEHVVREYAEELLTDLAAFYDQWADDREEHGYADANVALVTALEALRVERRGLPCEYDTSFIGMPADFARRRRARAAMRVWERRVMA